jgi:hypothetical protein
MGKMRKMTAAGALAAMVLTTATPAMARGYGSIGIGSGGGGFGYGLGYGRSWGGRRHHRNRVDAGDVIGAIAVIGVIAAVASAASKSKGNTSSRRDRDDDRYPDRRRDDRRSNDRYGNINSEDQAVDACAMAAEERAGQTGSVRDITNVSRSNDGWDVEGVVEERDGWRDRSADKRRFTCSVRFGSVENVYIESGKVAYNGF